MLKIEKEVITMANKKKVARKPGVCAFVRDLIRAGKTNAQCLAAAQKKFPESNIKIGSVGWLRADLIKRKEKVKTNAEVSKKAA